MTSVWPSIVLRCTQLVLAALIVAALASTVSFARLPPPRAAAPAGETPTAVEERPPLERFAAIAQRNIFRRKGAPAAISGTLPRTALDLELVATLVAGEGRKWYSLALVKDARDQVAVVREGQSFADGRIRLVSIEPRRVVIEHTGLLEVLALGPEQQDDEITPLQKRGPAEIEARANSGPSAAAASDASVLEALRSAARVRAGAGEPATP